MRFDKAMTRFYADIGKAISLRIKPSAELDGLIKDGNPKPLREWLKNRFGETGFHDSDISSVTVPNKGLELEYNYFLNSLNERTLSVSWSQLATLLRDDDFRKKYIFPNEQADHYTDYLTKWEIENNHLCGNYTDNAHCEFLLTSKIDTIVNGKKLDVYCVYCTAENKIRKINDLSFWTGLSPKFCPKRKQIEEDKMARKMQFDTAITKDMRSAASDSYLDNIKMIDINQIAPSRDNFYEISNVELLADDIEREGLKQSLVVFRDSDTGMYQVKSGHRRLAAIKLLINEKRRTSTKIPCYVDGEKSSAESQFDLIMLNATQRKYTDADLMHEYEEITRVLKELESEGKPIKGRMRDNIAKILKVSNGQIGKLDNIRNNAVPEIKNAVRSGEMSISTANEVAKLAPEKQKDVAENKPKISSAEVKQMQDKKPSAPKKNDSDFDNDFDDNPDEDYEDDFDEDEDEEIPESSTAKSCSLSGAEVEVLLKYFDHLMYYSSEEDEAVLKNIRGKMENRK